MSLCYITLTGNAGRDAELRYQPNGTAVCEFSVAVGHSRPDGAGGWTDEGTDWYRVTVWGKPAERAAEQVRKGSRVLVMGRLRQRAYEAKDGSQRLSMDVTASECALLDRAAPGASTGAAAAPAPARDDDLDSLPF